jgi:glyoxylase I family protein
MILSTYIDHMVFRVSALDHTERFYTALLGEPERTEGTLIYRVGDTLLFFTTAADHAGQYNKENVGLNHVAFGIRNLAELQTIEAQLSNAGVANSGIKIDNYGLKEFIWLDDPDGIRIEFYLRSE